MDTKEYNLGLESAFTTFPTEVRLNHETYFLVRNESSYQLLSSRCPHAGGTVMDYGSTLVCPIHYWSFDKTTGACINFSGTSLDTFEVALRDGYLIALSAHD